MKVLYFAWLRQRIGTGEETLDLPEGVSNAGELMDWLKAKGPGYEQAFQNADAVKIAVNQTFGSRETPVAANDEVAFFPPVTGG
ncbi:MAG: molybdopterin converting factor subunit 1 [Alphaproteobacteria bacterium]|jgi:molybdopterin synthase sulfur carrier subunit|uniref:molybdopterin converting factor subunit 1 n=1 Tax=Pacificispira sp. TaxID=2888761 RepID=UPI001B1970F9|nr:molybdopterin converting factor subunit 1 [Alphaproteobacteria bacterium]MEC9264779.1 molybdopterin converting factor subunit 1 [Pseudomonadota bacterium]